MGKQHEVTTPQKLLDAKGHIAEPGFAKQLVWKYSRDQIKAPKWRIKEWDYYLAVGDGFAAAFTISDLGYLGLISVSLLDFKANTQITSSVITVMPMGKYNLPADSSAGDVCFKNKKIDLQYLKTDGQRRIICKYDNFKDGKTFECNIVLEQPPMDTMCIATPWAEKPNHFYYNQKINCMPASGSVSFDGKVYTFNPETDFGILDWGRGVWTYDNTWYWASGNQRINGKPFGFNLGYGFSDRSSASENMIFYDGKAHKLDEVVFRIPVDANGNKEYMKPWKFTSNDGRFECDFTPIMDRSDLINALVIITDQHQVFGKLNGKCVLDSGEELEIKDMLMFAEDVRNKY